MKTKYILLLIFTVVAVVIIFSTLTDTAAYSNFSEAEQYPGKTFSISGKLNLSKEVVRIDSSRKQGIVFVMEDSKGNQREIVYWGDKPQDFERSEQIVVKGTFTGKRFTAKELLLKCPSKYSDNKPAMYGDSLFKGK